MLESVLALAEYLPLKQGLRRSFSSRYSEINDARRVSSTRTRMDVERLGRKSREEAVAATASSCCHTSCCDGNGHTDGLRPCRGFPLRAAREPCGVETRADLHRIEIFFVT